MPRILAIGYGDPLRRDEGLGAVASMRLNPPDALTLTRRLYGRCPRSYELSVTGADFGPREGLSTAVAARPDDLLHRGREIIQGWSAIPARGSARIGRSAPPRPRLCSLWRLMNARAYSETSRAATSSLLGIGPMPISRRLPAQRGIACSRLTGTSLAFPV